MRDYQEEFEERVAFIKNIIKSSKADGIVYGNSGGKDSALVGILCKAACENTVGIIMPCSSKRNYNEDVADAQTVADKYGIETKLLDLQPLRETAVSLFGNITKLNKQALSNIAPRLRMTTLYAFAASENRLVAGTGNKSEYYVGYFTKWGDGAHDFNPIADLSVTEVYEFLRWLKAPECVINKAPSAALFDGQTDEEEMGVSYNELDAYIDGEKISSDKAQIIKKLHNSSNHKRDGIAVYQKPSYKA